MKSASFSSWVMAVMVLVMSGDLIMLEWMEAAISNAFLFAVISMSLGCLLFLKIFHPSHISGTPWYFYLYFRGLLNQRITTPAIIGRVVLGWFSGCPGIPQTGA